MKLFRYVKNLGIPLLGIVYIFCSTGPAYAASPQRRNIERYPFYDKTAEQSVCDTLLDTGTGGIGGGVANVPTDARARLLAIKNVGGPSRVDAILSHLQWYQEAGAQADIPWQMLVGVHFREGLSFTTNPSNGQGVFQLYSLSQAGESFPAGAITKEEWVRQAVLAGRILKSKSTSNMSPINAGKTLTATTTDTNLIKDTLLGYNGKGATILAVNRAAAGQLGFAPASSYAFEGSAYVMNYYDLNRQGMTQCASDGCGTTNKSANPGSFLFFEALSGITGGSIPGGGGASAGDAPGNCNNPGGIGVVTDPTEIGSRIVATAAAEIGHREWDARVLEYTDGHQENWCADFVSWVYRQSGSQFTTGTSGGWRLPGVIGVRSYLQSKGQYFPADSGYTPSPGDIVIFLENGRSHTGIVEKFENGRFYTIEGNASNQVKRNDYALTERSLSGFGRL